MKCRHLETVDRYHRVMVNPSRQFVWACEGVRDGASPDRAPSGAADVVPSGA
jgi:hypothetical protein